VQEHELVREPRGQHEVVGDQQDPAAGVLAEPGAQPGEAGQAVAEVHVRGGLVEQPDADALGERARQQHAPPLAARQRGIGALGQLAELERRERSVGAREVVRGLAAERAEERRAAERHHLAHAERKGHGRVLRHHGDALRDLAPRQPGQRTAGERDLARVRAKRPRERAEQRGLARAVRSGDDHEPPGLERQVHSAQHRHAPERVRDPARGDERGAHDGSRASSRRSSTRNSGPPTSEVSAPTGSSVGASTTRASVSATSRNAAPASADAGTSSR